MIFSKKFNDGDPILFLCNNISSMVKIKSYFFFNLFFSTENSIMNYKKLSHVDTECPH